MLPTLVHEEEVTFNQHHGPSISTAVTADINACLIARIGWCHRQATKALTIAEAEEWRAEEQGLIDAFLKRDRRYEHQDRPVLRERYTMGVEDGRVLMLAARIRPVCGHRYHSR